jgi:hypothetical protein
MPPPARVRAGVVAYAAGDALGVPWEGRPASAIRWEAIDQIPTRGDWPAGATSDDTAQLLLVAGYLCELGAVADEREFLTRLAAALPDMRGVGPSTRAAVERFVATGDVRAAGCDTDGAAMRALPIGWALPVVAAQRRRELTIRLSRTTHGAAGAIGGACVVTAMASWAIQSCPPGAIIDAAVDEIGWLENPVPRAPHLVPARSRRRFWRLGPERGWGVDQCGRGAGGRGARAPACRTEGIGVGGRVALRGVAGRRYRHDRGDRRRHPRQPIRGRRGDSLAAEGGLAGRCNAGCGEHGPLTASAVLVCVACGWPLPLRCGPSRITWFSFVDGVSSPAGGQIWSI